MKNRKLLTGFMLVFLILLVLPFGVSAEATTSGSCGSNATWTYNANTRTLTISGEGEMQDYMATDFTPFYDLCDSVEKIVVEPGITSIGMCSFGRFSALKSVTLPDTLTRIGPEAFYKCEKLTSIVIPENVTVMRSMVFSNCSSLSQVTLPQSLTEVGGSMFENCTSLKEIVIPSNVTVLPLGLFAGCTSLETVTLPEGPTEIGYFMFLGCTSITRIVIPSTVETLRYRCFKNCTSLAEITIPENVTCIEEESFTGCTGLKKITFRGDAPVIKAESISNIAFSQVNATVCYPFGNSTWDDIISSNYWSGGTFTWQSYLPNVSISRTIPHTTGNIIYWDAVECADIYQIYRLRSGETSWMLLKNTRSLGYKDETAVAGIKYYYKIVARNGDVKSDIKTTASVGMVRPGAAVKKLGNAAIYKTIGHSTGNILYWNAVDGAKIYQVYRLEGNQWVLLKNTGSLGYKDETAPVGVKCYYKIVARNGDVKSDIKTTVSASATRP